MADKHSNVLKKRLMLDEGTLRQRGKAPNVMQENRGHQRQQNRGKEVGQQGQDQGHAARKHPVHLGPRLFSVGGMALVEGVDCSVV